jgi:PAS domain S-box-containing protein
MGQESAQYRQMEEVLQEESTRQKQTEERLARLETLVRLSRLISSSLEMTQVLTAICQATATLLQVPHVTIWMADEASRTLVAPACSDVEMVPSLPRTTISFGQGTLGWVAQYRQPLNIPDVFADGRVLDLDWWRMRRFRSRFATPILHQETLLGVLGMIGYEPFSFSPDDLWLLQQLLAQATVAIRGATLYQTVQRAEEYYRFITEQQTDLICRFRPDTTLTFVNEAYCRYFGKTREELIGHSFLTLLPPQARAAAQDHVTSLIAQPRNVTYEHEVCLPQGGTAWQQWVDHAIVDAQGQVQEFLSVGRDITDRKRIEDALRQSEAALRAHQAELQSLASKLIWAQEEERRRLARELHDDLSQRLAFLAIETGRWEKMSDVVPPIILDELHMLHEQLVTLATDVHALSHQLHSSMLDDLGLVDALRTECAGVMQREGVTVSFEAVDVPTILSREVTLCLYRILQEGLRNVVKHACAKHVEVVLRRIDDLLDLTIHDTGVGFVPEQMRGKAGLGLASMAERVRLVQGTFTLVSQPGHGTTIGVRVPLDKEEG